MGLTGKRVNWRPALALASLVALAFGLVGCFHSSKSADDIVKEAFSQPSDDITSGKFSLSARATNVKGLKKLPDGEADAKLSGSLQGFDDKKKFPQFDLSLVANAGKIKFSAGATSTGEKLFVNYQGTDYAVPDQLFNFVKSGYEEAQQEASTQKDADSQQSLAKLGIDPSSWLVDLKKGSDESIGGVDTYNVTGKVDVDKMAADLAGAVEKAGGLSSLGSLGGGGSANGKFSQGVGKAVIEEAIKEGVKSISFALNTGKDDGVLRRFNLKASIAIPKEFRKELDGLASGDLEFDVEISDLNEKQTVEGPASTKPLDELIKELGLDKQLGSLGGLSGLSGSGSSPTTTNLGEGGETVELGSDSSKTTNLGESDSGSSSGPSAEETQEYLKCIEKAQGKSADELQKCVEKLGD